MTSRVTAASLRISHGASDATPTKRSVPDAIASSAAGDATPVNTQRMSFPGIADGRRAGRPAFAWAISAGR
jgi:hypothetical protein